MKTQTYILIFSLIFFVNIAYSQTKKLTVDASDTKGSFEMIVGAHGKPENDGNSFIEIYKKLGFEAMRNHDYYGPTDWYTIFPNWDANEEKESSYDFRTSDSYILALKNAGFDILFRLGSSWKGKNKRPVNDPPGTIRDSKGKITHKADEKDFKKFAVICKHIVMHYNNGWANGHYLNIKKWEIWNEPSLSKQFWSGDYKQFREMFAEVALTLKKYNNSLIIGGPGQEGMSEKQDFIDNLFSYCQKLNVPIDFYSFHTYGGLKESLNPYEVVKKYNLFRGKLDKYGYKNTYISCTEFNSGPSGMHSNSSTAAAFVGAFLTYSELNNIKESYFYRADDHPMGLIGERNGKLRTEGYTFVAWKTLKENTVRISASGGNEKGFTVIASKNKSTGKLYILISNFPSENSNVDLSILNLKEGTYKLTRREISGNLNFEIAETKNIQSGSSGESEYRFLCKANSLSFIEVE